MAIHHSVYSTHNARSNTHTHTELDGLGVLVFTVIVFVHKSGLRLVESVEYCYCVFVFTVHCVYIPIWWSGVLPVCVCVCVCERDFCLS